MFQELETIHQRPEPFERYTARELWTDPYTSEQMLQYHLDEEGHIASRSAAFIDRSVEWITSRFNVSKATSIADFGCGPGLYTSRLARTGAEVTGIDFSARSIQHAEEEANRHGLQIRHVNEDYLEFDTDERFDLVLMITCDLCALSPAQRQQMLGKFTRILRAGGAVLLDVYSLAAFHQRRESARYELIERDGFWSPERHYEFLTTFKYDRERVVLDKHTIVEATRVRTIYNWFQYFNADTLRSELAASGLEVEDLYGDVAGSHFDSNAQEFAVVARRALQGVVYPSHSSREGGSL